MEQDEIKKLKFWIKDADRAINQDRHQYCINNDLRYEDYYPFLIGELRANIRFLKQIIERT